MAADPPSCRLRPGTSPGDFLSQEVPASRDRPRTRHLRGKTELPQETETEPYLTPHHKMSCPATPPSPYNINLLVSTPGATSPAHFLMSRGTLPKEASRKAGLEPICPPPYFRFLAPKSNLTILMHYNLLLVFFVCLFFNLKVNYSQPSVRINIHLIYYQF